MADISGFSSLSPLQRGPKACTNCRRRKIKCDGARPLCNQCRLRPPRSKEPCQYPRPESQIIQDESSSQMIETIHTLKSRIQELEYLSIPDPTRIYLNQPYGSRQGSHTPDIPDLGGLNLSPGQSPINMLEPPPGVIAALIDVFLDRFANSGYFFLHSSRFRQSALLPLPFGHRDRPSPALLSAVYLWGSLLSHVRPHEPYTPEAFLVCVLQNIPQDLGGMGGNPQQLLETIQAEVLLSFYYLHTACSVQGRYHASVAASIALGANLHLIRSPQHSTAYPPFVLQMPFPLPRNAGEETARIDVFWAVVTINNYWAGAEGSSSPIPSAINVDTPWPSTSQVMLFRGHGIYPSLNIPQSGATITKFLNGNDDYGSSTVALLTKASILLERIIAFAARTIGPPDPTSLAALDHRLHTFQASLPPLPGAQPLVLTHALVDFAIVRLHAPYMRTSDSARGKCLSAAARVVLGVSSISILDGARNTDPMFGPVYAGVASVYINEITALGQGSRSPRAQAQARELETRLGSLMGAVASLAAYSPLIERCFVDMRAAYAGMSG
ncbi:hypothetical protein B0H19DRAFT_1234343 [Mycena capillaripes]|nr:hypothetical protein B0H19DRAFT_1234343 [Mycena capillaripes]